MKNKFNSRLGIPGNYGTVDETFTNIEEMHHHFDRFLDYFHHHSSQNLQKGERNFFGFIIQKIRIVLDPAETETALIVEPGQGSATILVPLSEARDPVEWGIRKHQIISMYLPSLPLAQIQAQAQLFRLLKEEGRKKLKIRIKSRSAGARK